MNKRSKKYNQWKEQHCNEQNYNLENALDILQKNKLEKFDSILNLNFFLNINPKKSEHNLKGFYTLPHPPKFREKITVFTDKANKEDLIKAGVSIVGGKDLIADIASSKKIDFSVALATPEILLSLKKIAPILGPKKLMPSAKNNTVALDLFPIIKEFIKGKKSFFSDGSHNVHFVLGKLSEPKQNLIENFNYLQNLINKIKPENVKGKYLKAIHLSGTMSPSFKLIIEK